MFIAIHTFLFSIAHCPFEELIEQIYDTLMETNIVNEKVVSWVFYDTTLVAVMVGICTSIICLNEENSLQAFTGAIFKIFFRWDKIEFIFITMFNIEQKIFSTKIHT